MSTFGQGRIPGYDVARCLAIFGMVVVNFRVAIVGVEAGNVWLWRLATLFDGRASATFVVLAGVGLSLMAQRARQDPAGPERRRLRVRTLKRAACLLVAGLALQAAGWTGDILHYYAFWFAIGLLFVRAGAVWLWTGAFGFFVVSILLHGFVSYETGWNWETLEYDGFWTAAGFARNLLFNGWHPIFPWMAFFLVGMSVGRMDVRRRAVRHRLLWGGLAVAALAEVLAVIQPLSVEADAAELLWNRDSIPPGPLYMAAAGGTAVAVIALALMAGRLLHDRRGMGPFVAAGRMALTLYVAHILIGLGILEIFGRLGRESVGFALAWSAAFCVLSTLFAFFWYRRFEHGPLEWVLRRCSRDAPAR